MKSVLTLFFVIVLVALSITTAFAQATGDYRSKAIGDWNSATTWEKWNGSTWITASTPPTGSEVITIQTGDTVDVNVAVTINDTLKNQGGLTTGENLTIGATGVFQHDQDAGDLPSATWADSSTMYMTGSVSTAPNNRNQNYYNVVFNTPGLISNLNMALDTVTIRGDIRVVNTNTARWYLTSATGGDTSIVTIMGDLIVEDGNFSSNGTGNGLTVFDIHQYGDIVVTGGNFSVSRGSQGGSGLTRWYLHEGNFSMSNATTQNSNAANARFIFDKQGEQSLTLGSGNTLTALPIVVDSGTILDLGESKVRGSGRFEVNPGAGIATASEGGLDSAIVVTGNVLLDTTAQYIFKGTTHQVTGALPPTVWSMTIDNPDTVVLSQSTTITGPLKLNDGIFDNTIPFTLGPAGWIIFNGGNLLVGVPVSAELAESAIPETFFVNQNFPNPFNPTTTISYGLPEESFVTAKVYNMLGQAVATLFEGKQSAGYHQMNFDASRLPSGVYIYRIQSGQQEITKQMVLLK